MIQENVTLPREHYLNAHYGWKSWLFTTDHKRIGLMYMISITLMFFIGGFFALLIRLELLTPQADMFNADQYNKLFTLHGVVLIFFFLIPSIPAVLGNFFLPIMIGAKDVAFPKLNLFSWYIFIVGALMGLWITAVGGIETGWTFYTPYSSSFSSNSAAVAAATLAVFITGFSSILTGLNFIVTVHKMRAPGMTWFRMPLFIWSIYATSIIQVLATPVLGITMVLLGVERLVHVGIFDPNLGGDPVLFQHMFWFYSHPAVYIIAIFSFIVWGHHMYVSSMSIYAGMLFSILSYLVAVPSAVKVFNWTATLYKGSVSYDTPMLYALGFIGLFTIGGLTGLFLASMGLDRHLHDTYFVIAHFHLIMVGGAVMGYFGGLHYWWPKMFGRMYPEWWGRLSALVVFLGFNLSFFPQFIIGYLGMPRRYHVYAPEFQVLNVMSTAGSSILGVGYLMPLVYFIWSLRYGKLAANPWGAKGLEWETTSPPPTHNFEIPPVVNEEAYNYPLRQPSVKNTGALTGGDSRSIPPTKSGQGREAEVV
jgi:cytochrome c oxidase subunit I